MLTAATWVFLGATGYAYVGYPVLLGLAARSRPREPRLPDLLPGVTLVVAALDERAAVADKMRNTWELEYPRDRLQVVVVTDGSTDGTPDVVRATAPPGTVVLHAPERRGKASAMRRGASVAEHDVIVFSDANNSLAPDALRAVVRPLGDPRVGAVTGNKCVASGSPNVAGGERLYWRYESWIKEQESRLGFCAAVIGELLAVRREHVEQLLPGIVNDDFFLAMQVARSGRKVAYAPDARSFEPSATSLAADAVRRRRMIAGRWQSLALWRRVLPSRRPVVMWQVLSHKYLRLFLPATMAGAFAANVLDVARRDRRPSRSATMTFLSQVAFYGLAVASERLPPAWGPVVRAAKVARYVVRANAATAEGLALYARRRSELHLWEPARVGETRSPSRHVVAPAHPTRHVRRTPDQETT